MQASAACMHSTHELRFCKTSGGVLLQAMIPFSEEELAYIEKLNPEADCDLLRRELPWLRKECLRTLTVATTFLKVIV